MHKIHKPKKTDILKMFVILAFLMMIVGCRALSEALEPDENAQRQNLPTVQREKPNLSSEPAKIDVDPDSDDLVEVTETEPDSPTDNSNTALAANNSSNENSSVPTDPNSSANTETETVESGGNYVVTFDSFGKVKTGMTVAQASQALGTELVRGKGYEDACFYVDPKGMHGVRFMVTGGKISRIDVTSNQYSTDKGAKVGDSEDKIKSLYPGIEVIPNKYNEKKHDMVVVSGDEDYMIIFETDGSRVTDFRVGYTGEVLYVEGCS